MLKYSPLKNKKQNPLKFKPLVKTNSTLKSKCTLKSSKNLKQKTIKAISTKRSEKSLSEYLKSKTWKDLRHYGLFVFSKLVKASANFKCELCGKPGTDAHHWYFTKAHNAITDIMQINGICLCRECHIKAHTKPDLYKEKISELKKFKEAKNILERAIRQTKTVEMIKSIISEEKKALLKIYIRYNYKQDNIVKELLSDVNITENGE